MSRLHAGAGILALLLILAFWTGTIVSECLLGTASVVAVKGTIVMAMWVLIPALAVTGLTGFLMARQHAGTLVRAKLARMRVVAINGILVLLPAAIWLDARARAGDFDAGFFVVQGLELAVGSVNLVLMSLNLRDGLRLSPGSGLRPQS